ncbi:MAG TPA: N-acetyl-D-Glu racemase DgcA [Chthoniobacterales bacterium]|nr:N-acetyl-D-Glu racemase DgcA [Chthoniobacterales bacterium]
MSSRTLTVIEQRWPLDKPFRIARGTRTEANVIVVTVTDGQHTGRGEAVPIARYNQSVASVLEQIESMRSEKNLDRHRIQELLPAGAARNALDCALWDLEAKISGKRAWELANMPMIPEVETSFTISLDMPAAMAAAARANATAPILKLKLGGDDVDLARVEAVHEAAPVARLLIDANESWSPAHYRKVAPLLGQFGIELIEQPFPSDADEVLETLDHPVPVCADESCHTTADLPHLINRYEAINVKLDKTGGLTEALLLTERARESGFKLLIGCMVCTSLGIAPARLLASAADYVDLDGPLLLARDRDGGLSYQNGKIGLPSRELWG